MNSRKNVRGQGMSEYLIIVALIAVAGIAVMGLFGNAARNQVAGLANELSGGTFVDTQKMLQDANERADSAQEDAEFDVTLSSYSGNNEAILQTGTRSSESD